MTPAAVLSAFYASIAEDATVGSSHISLYMAFYLLWSQHNWETPVLVKRKDVMRLAKMGSRATYHRCLKRLVEMGCLVYVPSLNPLLKSKIFLVKQTATENASGYLAG